MISNFDSSKISILTALKCQFILGMLARCDRQRKANDIIRREKSILQLDLEMDLYRCYACKAHFLRCPSCTSLVTAGMKTPDIADVFECQQCHRRMIVPR